MFYAQSTGEKRRKKRRKNQQISMQKGRGGYFSFSFRCVCVDPLPMLDLLLVVGGVSHGDDLLLLAYACRAALWWWLELLMVLLLALDGVCREVSKESNYSDDSRLKDFKTHKPSKGMLMSFPASVFVVWVNKSCSLCDRPFLAQAVATGLCGRSSGQPLCQSYLKTCNYQKTTMSDTLSATSGACHGYYGQSLTTHCYKGELLVSVHLHHRSLNPNHRVRC